MPITATQLLTAIESNELESTVSQTGEKLAIEIMINGKIVGSVGCLHSERPTAKVAASSVDVFPSPGLPDGFSIPCRDPEEAIVIAQSLDACFATAFEDLVNPD